MTSDFLATLIRIRQNPYTSSLFNESPIFNDVRFLSDSGFLFSSKKTLCWGHPNILLHWIYIKKHMVAYENNKFRHDVHICQPGLISKAYWPVWKCAYMLWKWQHLAILQRCLDLNLLYAAYLYTLDAVGSSRILNGKQKIGLTFNSDKLSGNDFTKFSKLTMCSAGASRCWLVQWHGLPPRHCTWSVLKFL